MTLTSIAGAIRREEASTKTESAKRFEHIATDLRAQGTSRCKHITNCTFINKESQLFYKLAFIF